MPRTSRWVLPLLVVLAASCSQRIPSKPDVATPPPPPTSGAPTDSSLAANLARWSGTGIDSYRYRFRWICFCVIEYVRVVEITVVRGAVVSVVDVDTGRTLDAQAVANYKTIEGLFKFVRESMDYSPAHIDVGFDPHLGYPSVAYVDYVSNIADDEQGFQAYALRPIHTW